MEEIGWWPVCSSDMPSASKPQRSPKLVQQPQVAGGLVPEPEVPPHHHGRGVQVGHHRLVHELLGLQV